MSEIYDLRRMKNLFVTMDSRINGVVPMHFYARLCEILAGQVPVYSDLEVTHENDGSLLVRVLMFTNKTVTRANWRGRDDFGGPLGGNARPIVVDVWPRRSLRSISIAADLDGYSANGVWLDYVQRQEWPYRAKLELSYPDPGGRISIPGTPLQDEEAVRGFSALIADLHVDLSAGCSSVD